jgi:RNA polymerase-binding protein DksA
MNKREMKKYEKLLLEQASHLSRSVRRIEEDTLYESVADNSGDLTSFAEAGTDNFERETALNIASAESEQLQDIADALKRIHQGNYGACDGCGEEIPKKRLEVLPAARHCVQCQSKLEKYGVL